MRCRRFAESACAGDAEKGEASLQRITVLVAILERPQFPSSGSCRVPEDIANSIAITEQTGTSFTLLEEVQRHQRQGQKAHFLKTIDALGLAREADRGSGASRSNRTHDDVRADHRLQPSWWNNCCAKGRNVVAYDPKGMQKATASK